MKIVLISFYTLIICSTTSTAFNIFHTWGVPDPSLAKCINVNHCSRLDMAHDTGRFVPGVYPVLGPGFGEIFYPLDMETKQIARLPDLLKCTLAANYELLQLYKHNYTVSKIHINDNTTVTRLISVVCMGDTPYYILHNTIKNNVTFKQQYAIAKYAQLYNMYSLDILWLYNLSNHISYTRIMNITTRWLMSNCTFSGHKHRILYLDIKSDLWSTQYSIWHGIYNEYFMLNVVFDHMKHNFIIHPRVGYIYPYLASPNINPVTNNYYTIKFNLREYVPRYKHISRHHYVSVYQYSWIYDRYTYLDMCLGNNTCQITQLAKKGKSHQPKNIVDISVLIALVVMDIFALLTVWRYWYCSPIVDILAILAALPTVHYTAQGGHMFIVNCIVFGGLIVCWLVWIIIKCCQKCDEKNNEPRYKINKGYDIRHYGTNSYV